MQLNDASPAEAVRGRLPAAGRRKPLCVRPATAAGIVAGRRAVSPTCWVTRPRACSRGDSAARPTSQHHIAELLFFGRFSVSMRGNQWLVLCGVCWRRMTSLTECGQYLHQRCGECSSSNTQGRKTRCETDQTQACAFHGSQNEGCPNVGTHFNLHTGRGNRSMNGFVWYI